MNQGESGIFVLPAAPWVYVRVIGRGSFRNSRSLRAFAADMIQRGSRQFVLDLEQCGGMDSTFLGVLTGIGLSLRQENPPVTVHVIHAAPHSRDLLKSLWLDRLFSVKAGGAELPGFVPPAGADLRKLPDSDATGGIQPLPREETREVMLTAHDDLVRADSRNAPKFAEVLKLLREEGPPP
jgi:anti-sigma B factor antagonist